MSLESPEKKCPLKLHRKKLAEGQGGGVKSSRGGMFGSDCRRVKSEKRQKQKEVCSNRRMGGDSMGER